MKTRVYKLCSVLLGCSVLLVGCNKKDENSNKSVLTPELIEANSVEKFDGAIPIKSGANNTYTISEDFTIIDSRYRNYGLAVTRSDEGYIGFYSYLQNTWLIAERLDPKDVVQYRVFTNAPGVGFILDLKLATTNGYDLMIFDAFGNSYNAPYALNSCSGQFVNGKYYLTLVFDSNYESTYYYYIDSSGNAVPVSSIPTPDVVVPEDEEEEEDDLGELVKDSWTDLSDIGLAGYALAKDGKGNYSFFKFNKVVSSFYVDNQYTYLGTLNKKAYFQRQMDAPEDANDYDFFDGNNKKYINHISVNLETGSKEEQSLGFVFNRFDLLKSDKEGQYLQTVSYRAIDTKKCLTGLETYIVDSDATIYDCISGLHIGEFIEYKKDGKSRYFNRNTKILYDEKFEVITYLDQVSPTYKASVNMFECIRNGKKGLVDLDGIVRLSIKYTSIEYDSYYDGKIIAIDGSDAYAVRINGFSLYDNDTLLGKNMYKIGGDEKHYPLYRFVKDNSYYLYYSPVSGVMFLSNLSNQGVYNLINYIGKNNVFYISDIDGNVRVIKYSDFIPKAIPLDIRGTRIGEVLRDGSTEERAIQINLNTTSSYELPLRGLSRIYVKFTVTSSSYNNYYFISYQNSALSYISESHLVDSYSTSSYYSAIGFNASYSNPMVISFNCRNTNPMYSHLADKTTLYIDINGGTSRNIPFACANYDTTYNLATPSYLTLNSSSTNTRYITFTAPTAGVYSFFSNSSVNSIYVMGNTQNDDTLKSDINEPFYLTNGQSISLKVVFNNTISAYSFQIRRNEFATLTYNSSYTNTISYSGSSTTYLLITYTPSSTGNYQISVSGNTIRQVVCSDATVTGSNQIAFNTIKSYKILVWLNSYITSSSSNEVVIELAPMTINSTASGYSYGFSEMSSSTYKSEYYYNCAMSVSFYRFGTFTCSYYKYGSGSSYGTLYIYLNGSTYRIVTSSGSGSINLSVSNGDQIIFEFRPNYYSSSYYVTVSNLSFN